MNKILLIDGNSIMNRGYYGLPEMTNSKGLHTNAVLGFLNIIFRIIDEEKPGYMAVAFDLHAPTFRHEMFKEYKGTRKSMDPELREQFPVVKKLLRAMNVTIIEQEGIDEDGAPVAALTYEGLCNWQDGGRVELTGEQKYVRITGRAYFPGDICPDLSNLTGGYGVIFGERREIAEGVKARNPDGTVNYTEVRFR